MLNNFNMILNLILRLRKLFGLMKYLTYKLFSSKIRAKFFKFIKYFNDSKLLLNLKKSLILNI